MANWNDFKKGEIVFAKNHNFFGKIHEILVNEDEKTAWIAVDIAPERLDHYRYSIVICEIEDIVTCKCFRLSHAIKNYDLFEAWLKNNDDQ